MTKMLGRGAIAGVACGACALALGTVVLLRADTARYPVSGAASGPTAAFGPAAREPGGGVETADSDAARAIDPALFSPGACMAFPPTDGDRHQTVFLDAGHGGIDPGGVGSTESGATVKESTVNLAVELDAMAILRAQGYRVVVSRTQNTTVARLTTADVDGALLTAQGVHNDVGPAKAGYFDTPSQMPGALIEPLFVTDPFEASIAASAGGQQVIAGALAKAIEQYLGVSR
jgi:N-acetylmuramoyl-L-alanine amidase